MTASDDPRRMRTDAPPRARPDATPAHAAGPVPAPEAPAPTAGAPALMSDTTPAGAAPASPVWHTLNSAEALERLGASRSLGLTSAEAATRLERYGPNRVAEAARTSPWRLLFEQFQNVLVIILLVGAAISIALGHQVEAIAIVVIVLFAVGLGFVQEYRAERAMEALRKMAAPRAAVLRDGRLIEVDADQVVPGDVLQLVTGARSPADARGLEAGRLKTDEAGLTGESEATEKVTEALTDEKLPV